MRNIITCFPGGKLKAFTMSYDDGNDCDERLVAMMRQYGVRGTFNINTGLCPQVRQPYTTDKAWTRMTLQECLALYGDDMEVAIHGSDHPYWDKLPPAAAMKDIITDLDTLEAATGKIIRGAAYPFGTYNDNVADILRLAGIAYCRTTEETEDLALPKKVDWLRYKSTCRHLNPRLMELANEFISCKPVSILRLFYVWGHSYEFVRDNNWEIMEELLKTVGGRDDVWYATNIEIVEYLNAAEQLMSNTDGTLLRNPTDVDIWFLLSKVEKPFCVPAASTLRIDRS